MHFSASCPCIVTPDKPINPTLCQSYLVPVVGQQSLLNTEITWNNLSTCAVRSKAMQSVWFVAISLSRPQLVTRPWQMLGQNNMNTVTIDVTSPFSDINGHRHVFMLCHVVLCLRLRCLGLCIHWYRDCVEVCMCICTAVIRSYQKTGCSLLEFWIRLFASGTRSTNSAFCRVPLHLQ